MHFSYFLILYPILLFLACNSQAQEKTKHEYTNPLIHESSPYLLQHAHNPVNWHPWNDQTLAKAKKEGKMLIISVGYAACHWCHVMEHESFEDTTVARIMNEYFLPIKVDREERPDVDDVYMTACQMASQNGCGWPLNAFALSDGRPVWAGTYFPKKNWLDVLDYFKKLQKSNPKKLEEYASQLTDGIQSMDEIGLNSSEPIFTESTLSSITASFINSIDLKKGGRKGAPKFPMPNNYEYLLQYYYYSGDKASLKAVTTTLDNIANGGIYDHLGGGWARYSVDVDWLAPHFEKMMYDNGQLISLYSNAYLVTKNPLYRKVVEESLEWVAREMTAKNGGFYSSLDADSEGEEGKFYVWTQEEIDSIINDPALSKTFSDYYETSKRGNWEHGKNILHRRKSLQDVADRSGINPKLVGTKISQAKAKLFNAREQRVRPGLDDKILTSWNAIMLKGYVDAYRAFQDKTYLAIAEKNADFILTKMLQHDGRLLRNHKDGKSVINGFLDDYALTIQALIALYEVTFEEKYLYHAKDLADYVQSHFYDKKTHFFFYTSDQDAALIVRKKEISDNVIPSSNSVMAKNLALLSAYFYKDNYLEQSKQMLHNLHETLSESPSPSFYSNWLQLYLMQINPPYEVAIVGKKASDLRVVMQQQYLPNILYLGGKNEGSLELLKGKSQKGETYIYVCQNKICKLPVQETEKAVELIQE